MNAITPSPLVPGQMPGGLATPGLVVDPAAWSAQDVRTAVDWVRRGGVLVVPSTRPAPEAMADLLGADPGPSVCGAEVVVEATGHPGARNLPDSVVVGDVHTLLPRPGTHAVLAASVHLATQAVVTVRTEGEGLVIGVACDPTAVDGGDVVARAVDRLCRRVQPDGPYIGVGLLGYGQHGGMGWYHGNATLAVTGLRLAAIAELNQERRDDAGKRFPEASLHDSVEGLLEDDEVDLVVVATPPSTHHALTRRVLEAGRHAVVEKPLCFTAAEADDLLATAATAGRMLTVHQNRRWDADFRAIRRIIGEGHVGEVFNVETFVGGFEHPCRLWHSDTGVSGGRLYDWGAHLIDQTLQLFGGLAPATVSAMGHKRVWHDVTNLDQVRVRMQFADGREAEFLDSDVLAVRRPKYVVQGTQGTIVGHYAPVVEERVTADRGYQLTEHHHAEGPARLQMTVHSSGWGLREVEVPGLPAPAHPFHRALADHLQLGDPIPVDPAEVRTVTAVLEAAHASAHGAGEPHPLG